MEITECSTRTGATSYLLPGGPCSSQFKMVMAVPVSETSPGKSKNGIEMYQDKNPSALSFCSKRDNLKREEQKHKGLFRNCLLFSTFCLMAVNDPKTALQLLTAELLHESAEWKLYIVV